MKQLLSEPRRVVRNLALIAGVLTVTFVAVPPAAKAGEFRAPHEVLHDLHKHIRKDVVHAIKHATKSHHGYRYDDGRRYSGYARYPRYERRYVRYPVVVGRVGVVRRHHDCNDHRFVSGYVAIPPFGIGFVARPDRRVDRDDVYDNDYDYDDRYDDNDRDYNDDED